MDMIRGEKDLNTQSSSWVPQTPMKPNSTTSRPICGEKEGNQVGYGFDSTNSVDMNKGFPNWEGLSVGNEFSMDSEALNSLPFGDLLALADSAAPWKTGCADSNGAGPSYPFSDPQFGASSSTSWNMGNVGGDMFYGPEAWINGSCAPAAASYGNSVPSQCDLNLPTQALTDTYFSKNMSSQFAPVTPDQSKKTENYRANVIHPSLNQISAHNRVESGNEVASTTNQVDQILHDKEQQQVKNLSTTAVSTGLQEDQNPEIDLNATQQSKPRRRKHRPKVVIEGQVKKNRKPRTPKTPAPKENPTGKRKYVRKKPFNKPRKKPVSEVAGGSSDTKATQKPARSCKRRLNFDFEGQVREDIPVDGTQYRNNTAPPVENSYNRVTSVVEAIVEKTQVGIAHDLARAMNSELQDYLSMPQAEASSPPIPKKTQKDPEISKPCGQSEMCNKEGVPDNNSQSVPRSPNNSNCSSSKASLSVGEQAKRLKRGPSCTTEPMRTNVVGGYFNSLNRYKAMLPESVFNNTVISGMNFATVQKEKRTQSILNTEKPVVDSSESGATACPPSNACANVTMPESICEAPALELNIGSIQTVGEPGMDEQGSRERTFGCDVVPEKKKRMSRKKSKYLSTLPVGPATCSEMQVYKMPRHPQQSMEGMVMEPRQKMTAKKRMKRNSSSIHHGAMQKQIPSVDEITEYLKYLDINRESNGVMCQDLRALVPYNVRYGAQNALVLYQKDGTMVPFEGPFDFIRKRKPRPKVDLDDETTRVWKLLLENINSEGIDGTDEDKAKWWEEERRVFQGRADSFIARMHLVQGDRRFSPWKGSVVDSVVGVFLTQNVSDHLSSSAFMSLAARFPLKSKPCFEDPEIIVEEPEECPDQLDYQRTSVVLHEGDCSTEKVAQDSYDGVRSTCNSECQSPDTVEISQSTADKEKVQLTESPGTSVEEKAADYISSSQDSSISFVDWPVTQSTDPNSVSSSSFVDLIRKETLSGLKNSQTENVSSYEEAPECKGKSQDKDSSDKSTTSLRMQATGHSEVVDPGHLFAEEGRSSDMSKKIQQNSLSEQSEVTEESVGQAAFIESTSLMGNLKNTEHNTEESSLMEHTYPAGQEINGSSSGISKAKSSKTGKKIENIIDWDSLRVQAQAKVKRKKTANTLDSLDWEAVRCADVNQIADAIKERGMNNRLAERIKAFLNRLVEEHEGIDLEWLRDVPPDKAKEYLLSIRGLGLKSVECVRLLTLHHLAFPVDTNVGRIAVRLGWVPLQPLPESLQLHLLELYPVMETIQQYLWPRLCKLDQRTLYELHYQMITFGKVFCTKSKPNCNACPMRGECRHFASAFASARLALPGPAEKSIVTASDDKASNQNGTNVATPLQRPLPLPLPPPFGNGNSNRELVVEVPSTPAPTIELPATPAPTVEVPATPGPIIEVPASPEPVELQVLESDIEDAFSEDGDDIPLIKLNIEELTQTLQNYMQHNMELQEGDLNKALVALTPEAASIPMPKLKNVNRLRTEHLVYELPDSHPLLEGMERRDRDDPCSYLLAIWTPGETPTSIQPPEQSCRSQESGELCDNMTCFSCNSIREANSQIVRGTLLIPCRTAMRGSFPLNGTYFQVNEVFADHASSINPIEVPRAWIWNLPRRTVYFGTSVTSIFKGLSTESIQYCFWRGFVCVRGFDLQSRAPRPLLARLHFPASRLKETRGKEADQKKE